MIACAMCAHPVPSGARFCPSCGSPVDARRTALEERRVVTVLFADLVGYTALAEHLDPEQVKRLIESCFERLVADIETFGGRVDKLLGDAIVALFGAPVAHEDDAERAVRAGAADAGDAGPLRQRASRRRGRPPIEMRVGINTGEVLVGTLAGTDYTAMGDVVNTASRLQSMAPPGRVLIGSATAALCSAAIAREPFGVTQIRGREQVEQSWLVTGRRGRRHPARAAPTCRSSVGVASARCSMPPSSSCAAGTAGSCRSSARPAPARPASPSEIVDPLENEAIVVRTACAPYGESKRLGAGDHRHLRRPFGIDPDVARRRRPARRREAGPRVVGAATPATPSSSGSST